MNNNKQQGAVLVISLMLLLVMTLLGISGMQGTILEEKMSGNMRDRNLAFQAAEAVLYDGEVFLDAIVNTSNFDNSSGLYDDDTNPDYFAASTWSSATSYSGTMPGVNTQPRYVIKNSGVVTNAGGSLNIGGYSDKTVGGEITVFHITARGTGGSDTAQVILQTYFGKRF